MGVKAMKIWPFDQFGVPLGGPVGQRAGAGAVGPVGYHLRREDLKKGISYVEDIRNTVGDKIEICIEGHARWDLTEAVKIAHALEPYDIMWLEEIIPPDNVESYSRLKHDTTIPLCVSERLISKFGFREVIEKNAADIIMPDMAWCGGISETRKICHMAETYLLPITSHDCIGPVALWSAAHLMLHIPNAMIMETVRAYYDGWYNDVMTDAIPIHDGMITLARTTRPGRCLARGSAKPRRRAPGVFRREAPHRHVQGLIWQHAQQPLPTPIADGGRGLIRIVGILYPRFRVVKRQQGAIPMNRTLAPCVNPVIV